MMDAALPRWGFVILHTAYGMEGDDSDCSDAAWQRFHDYFKQTGDYAMGWWKGGNKLWPTHESVFVSDREALNGADTAARGGPNSTGGAPRCVSGGGQERVL
jgi:hypothetical protein